MNLTRANRTNKGKFARKDLGLTMIELLIGIAVLAIALGIALPNFASVLHKNRINSAASNLYASLNLARSEAVKQRCAARVCPSSDGSACRNDGDWSDGWLVFVDSDADGVPDATEIIRLTESVHPSVLMQADNTIEDHVQFNATGDAFGSAGQFRICHSNSAVKSKALSVSAVGRTDYFERTQVDCDTQVDS